VLVFLDDQQLRVGIAKVVAFVDLDDPENGAAKADRHPRYPFRNLVAA
jgi:hypothetical protein